MRYALFLVISLSIMGQLLQQPFGQPPESKPLEKSRYFAFADREYIFTIEVVKPGVLLVNFIAMADRENTLFAKNIRLSLENGRASGELFLIDTGNPQEPVIVPSLRIHPRSSFGARLDGDFGDAKELTGATIRLGVDDFDLVPLTRFDFEDLALKVSRLNLGSPDFSDAWGTWIFSAPQ